MEQPFTDIFFLVLTPLTQRDRVRFGIDVFTRRGYRVTVVDLTVLINSDYLKRCDCASLANYDPTVRIGTWEVLENFFRERSGCLVVDFIGGNHETAPVYRIFKKYRVVYLRFCSNMIPMPLAMRSGTFTARLFRLLKELFGCQRGVMTRLWEKRFALLDTLPSFLRPFQSPRIVLTGGEYYAQRWPRPDRKTETLSVHALDYDIFLEQKNRSLLRMTEPTAVFLDEYFPYHPDYLVRSVGGINLDPKAYYGGLNRFFAWFEDRYRMKVVIAAHPSARYDQRPECFPGRECIQGRTVELIQSADCVLAQCSTAINFAVLYRKPLVFLTSDGVNATRYGACISCFASQFRKSPLNVDVPDLFSLVCDLSVNEKAWKRYSANYIKAPGSPEKPFWDIVADRLSELRTGDL